jgi:hypothetical protein
MKTYAFDLDKITPDDIPKPVSQCYRPRNFADAGRHVMKVIHGIPNLFEDVNLGEVEIYIGRSHFDPNSTIQNHGVFGRFISHKNTRGHEYAIIALACDTDRVALWERAAINIIKKLKDSGKLCVSDIVNTATHEAGAMPKHHESLIYITWKRGKKTKIKHLTQQQIDSVSEEISEVLNNDISENKIKEVLSVTMYVSECSEITWCPNHIDEDPEDIGLLTISDAIDKNMAESIRTITGDSLSQIRKILENTHGNTHLRNAFTNWPDDE